MLKILSGKRAQTTLEYAILIGVVVAGLIAMQTYLKRGVQGKLKESADSMGQQFSPGYTTYNYTTTSRTSSNEDVAGGVTRTEIDEQVTDRTGQEDVQGAENEYWWR